MFDFERTQADEYPLQDIEKSMGNADQLQSESGQGNAMHHASGGGSTASDIVEEDGRPATPALHIELRQSLDQRSVHIAESPVLPGEWLSDGTSPRF
jgi:hypothetical protein